jgi:hypothetical protein
MHEALRQPVDLGHDDHASLLARRALLDVDTGEPQKLLGQGLLNGL